jgi:hypothetical protein
MRVIYGKRIHETVSYGDVVVTDRGNEYLVVRSPFGGITKANNDVLLVDLLSSVVIDEFEKLEDIAPGKFHDNLGRVINIIPKDRLALMVDGDAPEPKQEAKPRPPIKPQTSSVTTTPAYVKKAGEGKDYEARF